MISKYVSLVLFICLIAIGCNLQKRTENTTKTDRAHAAEDFTYPFRYDANIFPLVAAHRATSHEPGMPENSLESIKALKAAGVRIVECDVRTMADGTLILMHDDDLGRTTNASGRASALEYAYLNDVRLTANRQVTGFKVPRLHDVLSWNANEGDMILELDIKRGTDYEKVIDLLEAYDQVEHVIFIVYSANAGKKVHSLNDDLVISVPVRNMEEWNQVKSGDIPLNRIIAFTGTIRSESSLYDTLHNYKIPAIFGTLGNIDRQAEARGDRIYLGLIEDGVDIFATDRALNVHQLIEKQ